MSFPTRQSHYSRQNNNERVYLSPELSIEQMYEQFLQLHNPEYVEYMKHKREALINHYYHDVFVKEFNIHFGFPCSDTCDTCDLLKIRIDSAENGDDKNTLEEELQSHLKAA